ncbi:DNA topoisomerase 3-alpha [Rhincodon typus]|uniref:DNA topoisomerase 3-alpha n=1 Tax=Rhincodon typus TaxID=259920 RepID=UPI00202E1C17|nr:DNA topoisomerase 3-alpha [Rhincodon typus]
MKSVFSRTMSSAVGRLLQARQILCVAEKNDAAKSIAEIMSGGRFRRREGLSKFNKIYEYEYHLNGKNVGIVMTSVSGHLLELEFKSPFQKWRSCNPVTLFDAEVEKYCPENYVDIKRTLEREVRKCQALILWTDCDREGENIGFEIINVCKTVKPNLQVLRARFSEITPHAIRQACENLVEPDQKISDAVDVRQELDLRIGASFTRFQTLRLQKIFPNVLSNQLISYGSCQFPTLGFVVERFKAIQAFVQETFYKIKVTHETEDGNVEFNWKRHRLFNHTACLVLYQICMEDPVATVLDVFTKPKSKWRPLSLDTVVYYLSCMGYPNCKSAVWFPDSVLEVSRDDSICPTCKPHPIYRLKFKFKRGSVPPLVPLEFVGCIGGCDEMLREILELRYLRGASQSNNQIVNHVPQSGLENRSFRDRRNTLPKPQEGAFDPLSRIVPSHVGSDNNAVVCNCGQDALLLTVRKEGPNQGRRFYKCNGGSCNFFLWADQDASDSAGRESVSRGSSAPGTGSFHQAGSNRSSSGREAVCTCNQLAVTRTVQKDGPNKGRTFHTCAKPRDQQCGFFQWADENVAPGMTNKRSDGSSPRNGPTAKKPRTCGLCHQPGHTRTKCPQNR